VAGIKKRLNTLEKNVSLNIFNILPRIDVDQYHFDKNVVIYIGCSGTSMLRFAAIWPSPANTRVNTYKQRRAM